MSEVSIIPYTPAYSSELLRLLLELHNNYFSKHASAQLQELKQEKNINKSYEYYISLLNDSVLHEKKKGDNWKVFLAISPANKVVGFIVGSTEHYGDYVYSEVGKFEDWYVEDEFRNKGVGKKLYHELENWFRKKGCQQIISDTWNGYEASIEAHKELGFFVSGISFSKKLE